MNTTKICQITTKNVNFIRVGIFFRDRRIMKHSEHTPYKLGFLLLDGFSMIAFANALDTFRLANYRYGSMIYTWSIMGLAGRYTSASNGLSINHTCEDLSECDALVVCGGYETAYTISADGRQLLRRLAENGRIIIGICTGVAAMAEAGLLDGHKATLHWEHIAAAREHYPKVEFNENIYTLDRNRYTCAGGAAPLDLGLYLLRVRHGRPFAASVAELLVLDDWRQTDSRQSPPRPSTDVSGFQHTNNVVALMKNNLEEPLLQDELSSLAGISTRHMQRLFRLHFGQSPMEYYLVLRLERARQLLRQSKLTILEIALACGFSSPSSFSRSYRKQFGYPPKSESRRTE